MPMSTKKVLIIADNYREYSSALSAMTEFPQTFYHTNLQTFEKMSDTDYYALVLLDCEQNIQKGIQIVRKIKETTPQNLVLLIGASDSTKNIVDAFRSGVRDYIHKPLDFDLLRETVAALYRLRNWSNEKRSTVFMPTAKPLAVQPRDDIGEMMQSVIKHIDSNLMADIYIDELARIVNLSKFHFIRRFKELTGYTPKRYIIHKRIERAKNLMKTKDFNVTELSAELGFNYVSDFSNLFKKYTGLSPSRYRKSSRSLMSLTK